MIMAINWSIFDYKPGVGRNYSATVQEDHLDRTTLQEIWKFFATTVLAENGGLAWDYIRVEFWPDSGHIAIFPASSSNANFVAKAFAYVVFERLLERYERLADSEMDDEQFSEEIARILATWTSASEAAAKSLDLANLAGRSLVRLRFYDAGEEQPLKEFVVPS